MNKLTIMSKCNSCKSERTITTNNLTKDSALDHIFCTCGEKIILEEGIKNYLKSDIVFSFYKLVTEIEQSVYNLDVCVGKALTVQLKTPLKIIDAVFLSPQEFVAGVDIKYDFTIEKHTKLLIATSEYKNFGKRMGDIGKLSISVYGRNGAIDYPIWYQYIIESKRQILSGNYNLSIITSCIACESFIDLLINKILKSKGIDDTAINAMIIHINNIQKKVYEVLANLDNLEVKKVKEITDWKKLTEERNKIAHGGNSNYSKQDAVKWFNIAIDFIFYINRNSSYDLIYSFLFQ